MLGKYIIWFDSAILLSGKQSSYCSQALAVAAAAAAAITAVAMCAPSEFWRKTNWTKMWNVDVKWQRRAAAAVVSASAVIGEWKLKKGKVFAFGCRLFCNNFVSSCSLLHSLWLCLGIYSELRRCGSVAQSTCIRVRFKFSSSNRMPLYWIGPQRIGYRIFLFYFFSPLSARSGAHGRKKRKKWLHWKYRINAGCRDMVYTNSFVRFVRLFAWTVGLISRVLPDSIRGWIDSIFAFFHSLSRYSGECHEFVQISPEK